MSTDTARPEQPPAIRRLSRYARSYRPAVFRASLSSILNKVMDLAPPLLIGAAIDIVISGESSLVAWTGVDNTTTLLWALALVTVAVFIGESIFEYLQGIQWRNLAQSVQHGLRLEAYGHVQGLDSVYFEDRSTGDLMAVLNDDVNQLERFLDRGANDLLQVSVTTVLIGAIFFTIAPSVAWLAFLPVPFVIIGTFAFQRRIALRYADVRDQAGALNSLLNNNISGIATIKSFTAEGIEVERLRRESETYRRRNRLAIRLSAAFSPTIRMLIAFGFTATLVRGGTLAIDGAMSVGSFSVLVFLSQRLLWPLTRLGETFDLYHRAMASTNRILDVLDTEPALVSGPTAVANVSGAISFDDVHFSYHPDAPVLRGMSLEMPAGKTTAIVGSTGAGKTTVIKMLLRFYDPTGGAVQLDGTDLRELDLSGLRRAIGLVSQDVFLFHGTVAENIRYGNPEASDDQVTEAARLAEAHGFITELPDGYGTIVGERGQKLSGGQRQRISIARAIVKDPPILVLDEATSSVDNETEAAIQRSLAIVSEGRTTVVIAHRLSTIRHADVIYVIDEGMLTEQGHHDDLVAHGGIYESLWKVQTGDATRPHDRR